MNEIVKGGLYRHFKGMYYYVLDVATHSETGEKLVVYQKLYDDRDLYVTKKMVIMFIFSQPVKKVRFKA